MPMARFSLNQGVTDKMVGERIRELATRPPTQKIPADANAFFAGVFAIPAGVQIQVVADTQYVRHVVVPYYAAPPSADVDELLGVITVRGCGD
jgi:hypothetical protein